MLLFEIKLVFELPRLPYPPFSWQQENEPNVNDMLEIVRQYAEKYEVPIEILEDNAVLFVDSCENGTFSDMEVYSINFSQFPK